MAECLSALDAVHYACGISRDPLLYLLEGGRAEIYGIIVGVYLGLVVYEGVGVLIGELEDVFLLGARDDVVEVLRIVGTELVHACSCIVGYLLEVEHLVDLQCIGVRRHGDVVRSEVVLLVVLHCIKRSEERGDVAAGLAGQVRVDLPEVLGASGPADGLVDVAGSAVV